VVTAFSRLLIGAMALLLASSAGADKRPFTVADSIEMTELTEPSLQLAFIGGINFNWSPDGRYVALVTRRGELATGLNHYTLRLYSREELQSALRNTRSPARPPGRVMLTIATSTFRHGIERVTWDPGGRFLYCIARQGEEAGQVYELDLDTGRAQQVTSSDTDVRSYTMTADRQRVLYLAPIVEDWTERNRRGYVVGSHILFEVTMRDPRDADYMLGHHLLDRRNGKLRRLDLPPGMIGHPYVLSSDERFAIFPVQVRAMPAAWREYQFFRHWRELGDESLRDNGVALAPVADVDGLDPTFGGPGFWVTQYHVIDLATGTAKPLLDAPAVTPGLPPPISWSPDVSSVIVSHTYLPLAVASADDAAHRRSMRMIAEVDLSSGAVLPIADQPMVSSDGSHRLDLLGIDRAPDGSIAIRERPSNETRTTVTRYVKKAGQWTRSSSTREAPASTGLQLEVRQDPNTPPDVFVRDLSSGRVARILELNSQLHELSLGHVESFDWEDKDGHRFHGGLFLPPDYVPGKRLPVVLQTYGFRDDEFIVNGSASMTNAYSARALINQGMLVLQMAELALPQGEDGDFGAPGENALYLAGLEAAIDALDSRGYIDPDKVGLVGFSREGMHVQYAVTFTSRPIAAAIISDSATATPFCYAQFHGAPQPGLVEFERNGVIGATPWGKGMDLWLERSPAFHYDRIRTPLRIEFMNFAVPCTWDMYALLSRHRRPVELVHIPRETHPIQTPWARYTSQQGAVDWFNFWLKDSEDPDPAKQDQYKRWRVFREQQAIAAQSRTHQQVSQP
jgi:dipeptidyl aminopeptidase/acylaminoacyl peptidase